MGDIRHSVREIPAAFKPPVREATEYLLAMEARYIAARYPVVRGKARTQAISNSRVVIEAEHELRAGEWVQLSICWPVKRDGIYPMTLVVGGEVMRTQGIRAEIQIEDYDLRPDFTAPNS